jgi:hypothetical protein
VPRPACRRLRTDRALIRLENLSKIIAQGSLGCCAGASERGVLTAGKENSGVVSTLHDGVS